MKKVKVISNRQLRVGEKLKQALSLIFTQENFYNTALENQSVTISEVIISRDLKNAKIFVIPLGRDPDVIFMKALEEIKGKIRYILANSLNLKFCPELRFYPDNSFEYADKIKKLCSVVDS